MMQITVQHPNTGRYSNTTWNLGDDIPDIFVHDVVGVRLTDEELEMFGERSANLPTLNNNDMEDATETNFYGNMAKFIFGNLSVWAGDNDSYTDPDYDDED